LQRQGAWLLLITVITALLQYWQTKMITSYSQVEKKSQTSKEKTIGKKEDEISVSMQKQMAIMMPIMIGFFAYSFPLGLSLYWNTFTIFGIIQQYQLNKQLEDGEKKTG